MAPHRESYGGPFSIKGTTLNLEKLTPKDVFAITPADADLAKMVYRIYIGTGGTLVLTVPGSTAVRTITVPNAYTLECQVTRVAAASTATGLIGFAY